MAPPPPALLVERVYEELRRLARDHMRREAPGHTLQPTALVHEVYLRLLSEESSPWEDGSRIFAAAALSMRRILVEAARRRQAGKRGGNLGRVPLDDDLTGGFEIGCFKDRDELLDLDEALTRLEQVDARMAEVVQLRYFGGLQVEETAAVTGLSPRTVRREWEAARLWLYRAIATDKQVRAGERERAS